MWLFEAGGRRVLVGGCQERERRREDGAKPRSVELTRRPRMIRMDEFHGERECMPHDDVILVHVFMSRRQADELSRLAGESRVSVSEVVRRAMRSYTTPTPFEKLTDGSVGEVRMRTRDFTSSCFPEELPWHVVANDGTLVDGEESKEAAWANAIERNLRASELGLKTSYKVTKRLSDVTDEDD